MRLNAVCFAVVVLALAASAEPFVHPAGRFEITPPEEWTVSERLLVERIGIEHVFAPKGSDTPVRALAVAAVALRAESPLWALSQEQLAHRVLGELFALEPAWEAIPIENRGFERATIDGCEAIRFRLKQKDPNAPLADVWIVRRGDTVVRVVAVAPDDVARACVQSLKIARPAAPSAVTKLALVEVVPMGGTEPSNRAVGHVVTRGGLVLAPSTDAAAREFRVEWAADAQRPGRIAKVVARSDAGFVLLRMEGDPPAEYLSLTSNAPVKSGEALRRWGGPASKEGASVRAALRDVGGRPRALFVSGDAAWRPGAAALDMKSGAAVGFAARAPGKMPVSEVARLVPVDVLLEDFPELRRPDGAAGAAVVADLIQSGRLRAVMARAAQSPLEAALRMEAAGLLGDAAAVRAAAKTVGTDEHDRLLRARALRRAGLAEEALQELAAALPPARKTPAYELERARCLLALAQPDKAIESADRARSLASAREPEPDLLAARIEAGRNAIENARMRFIRARETQDGCLEAWLGEAAIAERASNGPVAAKLYDEVNRRFPSSSEGPAGQARILLLRKKPKEAFALLVEAATRARATGRVPSARDCADLVRAAEAAGSMMPERADACLAFVRTHPDNALANVWWAESLVKQSRGLAYAHALIALHGGGDEAVLERAAKIEEAALSNSDVRLLLERDYGALALRVADVAPLDAAVLDGQWPETAEAIAVRAVLEQRIASGERGAIAPPRKNRVDVRSPQLFEGADRLLRVRVPRSYKREVAERESLRRAGGGFVEACFVDSVHAAELLVFAFPPNVAETAVAMRRIGEMLGRSRQWTMSVAERKATENALALNGTVAVKDGKVRYWRVELHQTDAGVRGALWSLPRSKREAAMADRVQIFKSLRVK